MKIYINRMNDSNRKIKETVDETDNRKDARYLVEQYSTGDSDGIYYSSNTPCKNWK